MRVESCPNQTPDLVLLFHLVFLLPSCNITTFNRLTLNHGSKTNVEQLRIKGLVCKKCQLLLLSVVVVMGQELERDKPGRLW